MDGERQSQKMKRNLGSIVTMAKYPFGVSVETSVPIKTESQLGNLRGQRLGHKSIIRIHIQ
jgi:hypothetical protein